MKDMFRLSLPARETQIRLGRFLVVGGAAAAVQFLLLAWLRDDLAATIAYTIAFAGGSIAHYLLNRFWALPSDRGDHWRQLGEYLGTVAVSYGVNLGLFALARSWLGLGVMGAAVVAVPPATLIVFLLLNYHVFRRRAAVTD